jgi:glycosyltransferase involved in cell wall biosynthesis
MAFSGKKNTEFPKKTKKLMRSAKKIFFLLPSKCTSPVGGFKVVYEYANRFSSDGYDVTVLYPALLDTECLGAIRKARRWLSFLKTLIKNEYSCKTWFNLNDQVKELWVYRFHENIFKEEDIVFATAAETAVFIMNARRIRATRLYYLIQNYENWIGSEELLIATWKANLKKIVIAPWLRDIAVKHGQDAELIENGLDFDYFKFTNPIENRSPYTVMMLYHTSENKGCRYAFEALNTAKQRFPELKCLLFGVFDRPEFLPTWYEYYKKPDRETHNNLYNQASIFIAPALMEGFGLTPAESMVCGCAVAATDCGGYRTYCKDNETALICESANSLALSSIIIQLITNNNLRISIAQKGNEYIKHFTWDRAYLKLKHFIEAQ